MSSCIRRYGKFMDQSVGVGKKNVKKKKVKSVKVSKNINRYKEGHSERDAIDVLVEQEKLIIKAFWKL